MPDHNIEDLFKEKQKLEAYSNAQANTIIQLSKKLTASQEEVIHLKKLLEGSVPLIKGEQGTITIDGNDQEQICRMEIAKLKNISLERELTLEEVKKLDIYAKILKDPAKAIKKEEEEAKKVSTEDLLKLVT